MVRRRAAPSRTMRPHTWPPVCWDPLATRNIPCLPRPRRQAKKSSGKRKKNNTGDGSLTIKGRAYIAGIYEHPTRHAPDKSTAQLHAEVAKGAIEDAGLT